MTALAHLRDLLHAIPPPRHGEKDIEAVRRQTWEKLIAFPLRHTNLVTGMPDSFRMITLRNDSKPLQGS
jgi:hypothetical protein